MRTVLAHLEETFGVRAENEPGRAGEVYVAVEAQSIPAIASALLENTGMRLAMVFAEDRVEAERSFNIYYLFEKKGDPVYLLLRAAIPQEHPQFPSLAPQLPSLNWQEREIQDWFGIEAVGHPNPRRVALHDNWPDVFPLRKDFALETVLPPFEGEQHVYRPTLGEGVFQVPVGPVHAGIIEPGHFNFAVAGEPILYLQLRMFYTHKGTEKLFESVPVARAVHLAECVSGDSTFAHAAAFCQAVEKAGGTAVPFRAEVMRTVLLEMERIANHLGDIGAIATDVGFAVANAHAGRVREVALRANEKLTGSRFLRGMARPGGVRRNWSGDDVDSLRRALDEIETNFHVLAVLIQNSDSTRDRLQSTGVLSPEKAAALGIVGPAGRASGLDHDVRRDHPYAAYAHLAWKTPVYQEGDVLHRLQVREDEVEESLSMIRAALDNLPPGECRGPVAAIEPGAYALSAVEGWRGEILYWIRMGANDRLERCKVKDPSLNNWPALVEAVKGNIIADFPVINKSFNLSYSGTDR